MGNALKVASFDIQSYDRILDGGLCSRKRPDFVIQGVSHMIVIECDEHQHRGVGYECEDRRMWDIAQALGMPTVFIRYNPDPYKTKGKRFDPPLETREHALVAWIRRFQTLEPTGHFLQAMYMFYDEFTIPEDCKLDPVRDPMTEFKPPVNDMDDRQH